MDGYYVLEASISQIFCGKRPGFFFFNALLANAFLKYNKKVTIKLK